MATKPKEPVVAAPSLGTDTSAPPPVPAPAAPVAAPVDPNPADNVTVTDSVQPPAPPLGNEGEQSAADEPRQVASVSPSLGADGPGPASFRENDEQSGTDGGVQATPTPEGSRSAASGDDPKVKKPVGTKTESGQELTVGPDERAPATRGDVIPSLEVANREGGIAGSELRRDPLDHDGNGRRGGAVPAGRTGSYDQVASERDRLKAENDKLREYIRYHAGDKGVDDALKDKQQPGDPTRNTASGTPIVPPQDIDQLRTVGIND